ncbi:MAG: hypothetical protein M3P27_12070, partial [Acidobacteriota bacterium]|nr:hypothetical protein [Acidobacteriota bacterium]
KYEREKRLDSLLDSALAQYGAAEPLHGMEERVLRRLHDGRAEDASRRAWWMWGGAAAALAAVVMVVVLLARPVERKPADGQPRAHQQQPEAVVPKQSVSKQSVPKQEAAAPVASKQDVIAAARQPVPQHPATEAAASTLPRRAVFPTPTPPTEQEILLARYVRVTPREEVLAQIKRKPLEFQEDPLSAPTSDGATSPHKAEGTK